MANTRISDLSAGGAFASTDEFPVVETAGVGPVKKDGDDLAEYIRDTIGTANVGGTGITFTNSDAGNTLTFDLTDMAEATVKGRAAGAGTGAPTDLSGEQIRAITGTPETLTADRTYFVRTTGNDSNDGLTSGNAFLTIQKAFDVIGELIRSIYHVTIDISGSYNVSDGGSGGLVVKFGPGVGRIIVDGDTASSTRTNTTITQTNNGGFERGLITIKGNGACEVVVVQNMTLDGGGATSAVRLLYTGAGGRTEYGNIDFQGSATNAHVRADQGGITTCTAACEISDNAVNHFQLAAGGQIRHVNITGNTLTSTPAFSAEFAGCDDLSFLSAQGSTWTTGSATGKRYDVNRNAVIQTSGGGATFFPGDVAGTTATGGVYN